MRSVKMKFTAMVLAACVLASATGEVDAVARENKAAESEGFGAELASMIRETTDKAGKKVSVKVTNIPATSLSQVEGGYVSVTFEAEYQYEKHQEDGTTAFYGQTALVDGNGKFLIPFEYGATKIYSSNDGVISYANDSFGAGVQTGTTYDEKTYLSKYYDTNLKELFKSDLADAGAAYDGMITSPTTIYDAKGNVTYELPADLQKASLWFDEDYTTDPVKGMPIEKMNYKMRYVTLGVGDEGLVPFGSAVPMNGKIELPKLDRSSFDGINEDDFSFYFRENAVKDGKLFGYVNAKGEIVIPQSFYYAGPFSEGLASVVSPEGCENTGEVSPRNLLGLFDNKENKCGFIDKTGKLVIPYEYELAYPFTNGCAAVMKNGKYGYIDKENKVVIPFEYDSAFGGNYYGMFIVCKDGKYGMVDKDNNPVIPLLFDDITGVVDGKVFAIMLGRLVIINFNEDSSSDFDWSGELKAYLNQVVRVNTASKTVKAAKLKKKDQRFKLAGTALSQISYKKKSGDKRIKVSKKGVVTLKKGMPKKTYKVKVLATAADNGYYKAASVTKTIKIKIK